MFQLIVIILAIILMMACGLAGFFLFSGVYAMNHEIVQVDCVQTRDGQVAYVGGKHSAVETVNATFYTPDGRLDPARQAQMKLGGMARTACPTYQRVD